MPRDDSDERKLSILLSAVSSVLRGTGAIASIKSAEQFHQWDKDSEAVVEVAISVSRINAVDVDAIRAALTGYGPTKADIDRLRKENDELRNTPDQQEVASLRRQIATLQSNNREMERRVRETEQRAANSTPSARIANLEGEIANLRKQLNASPSAEQDDRDPFAVRASLLELT